MSSNAITDIIAYRKADPLVATAGQPTETQFRIVAQAGFEVVVNLALHDDPRYSLPNEPGLVRSYGMEYVHIPVQFGSPTEEDLSAFFTVMEQYKGRKLFIHCAANKRVTAFLGLYRVLKQHWDVDKAFELMRSVWEPDQVWSQFIVNMLDKHAGS
jgi:protein tyrosine phosphatase (PTP) superfamily phosphohydrolase (DUF442 family)